MKHRIFLISALLIGALSTSSNLAATEYVAGVHFEQISSELPVTVPGAIEVRELFWYGCQHCFDLETQVEEWAKTKPDDVVFNRQPAIPSKNWAHFAKVYYTAELLGVLDTVHTPFFTAIHKDGRKFKSEAEIRDFFKGYGVAETEFDKTWNSFAVNTKLNRAMQLTRRYGITSVPTVVVNGKYSTNARMAGSSEEIFKVVDFLIKQDREAKKDKTASANTK